MLRSPLEPPGRTLRRALAASRCGRAGTFARHAEDQVSAARQRAHQIAQVLNAPDAVMLTDRIKPGGTATVVMSDRDRALVFTTAGLPRLPASLVLPALADGSGGATGQPGCSPRWVTA